MKYTYYVDFFVISQDAFFQFDPSSVCLDSEETRCVVISSDPIVDDVVRALEIKETAEDRTSIT